MFYNEIIYAKYFKVSVVFMIEQLNIILCVFYFVEKMYDDLNAPIILPNLRSAPNNFLYFCITCPFMQFVISVPIYFLHKTFPNFPELSV